jgi:DNA-binding NarL/FixJ family response regulator
VGVVDEAFAAVPRDLWWGGALWREPDNLEVARDLRCAGPAHEPPPRQRSTRAATERRREEVAELRTAGWTIPQIAASLDVSVATVDYDLKALRIAAGEHGATVAEYAARRAQVVALLDAGQSYRQIVRETGICFATVCRVGREWRKTHKETA